MTMHSHKPFAGRDVIGKIGGIAKNDKGNGEGKSLRQEIVLLQQKLNAKEEIIASSQQQINGQSQLLEAKDKIIALLEGIKLTGETIERKQMEYIITANQRVK